MLVAYREYGRHGTADQSPSHRETELYVTPAHITDTDTDRQTSTVVFYTVMYGNYYGPSTHVNCRPRRLLELVQLTARER